nr:IS66 family insertion sequence element accessory protein TnpB [Comamonas sp. JC664]
MTLTRAVRVFAYAAPVDMRRGFDGLSALVEQQLGQLLKGDVFLFVGRRRAKVLHFDGTGLVLFTKRLFRGRFARPWCEEGAQAVELTVSEQTYWLLLEKGPGTQWYAWTVASPDTVFHRILPSRSGATARAVLGDYAGIVLVGGYAAYQTATKSGPDGPAPATLAFCWAHVPPRTRPARRARPRTHQRATTPHGNPPTPAAGTVPPALHAPAPRETPRPAAGPQPHVPCTPRKGPRSARGRTTPTRRRRHQQGTQPALPATDSAQPTAQRTDSADVQHAPTSHGYFQWR